MSKRKIILAAGLLMILAAAGVVATWLYIERFDAGEYVQAVLDVSYKNDTELYIEITGTTENDADRIFEDNLEQTMAGFEASDMPRELLPQYQELIRDIAAQVSYTVGEPEKNEDGTYSVPVKVKPVTLFPDTYSTFQTRAEEYASQVTDSVMNGGDMPSDEEMQDQIYQIYYEVLRDRVDSGMLYGGARDIVLRVTKTGSRTFEINEDDMDKLDSILIEDVGEQE